MMSTELHRSYPTYLGSYSYRKTGADIASLEKQPTTNNALYDALDHKFRPMISAKRRNWILRHFSDRIRFL